MQTVRDLELTKIATKLLIHYHGDKDKVLEHLDDHYPSISVEEMDSLHRFLSVFIVGEV